jgi:hypothetical protein
VKVPVTTRALVQRINRKLRPEYRHLHACRRNSRWWHDLGDYYVTCTYRNQIVDIRSGRVTVKTTRMTLSGPLRLPSTECRGEALRSPSPAQRHSPK